VEPGGEAGAARKAPVAVGRAGEDEDDAAGWRGGAWLAVLSRPGRCSAAAAPVCVRDPGGRPCRCGPGFLLPPDGGAPSEDSVGTR
jgi:hypothetical protein